MPKGESSGSEWIYCFKRGNCAVFLNRWDEVIRQFDTYEEAMEFAKQNMHLIDVRIGTGQLKLL